MLHPPCAAQQPGTGAGQVHGRAANTVQRSRSTAAVRLLVGTLVVAGTAGFAGLQTSLAKDAQSQTAAAPSWASSDAPNYWQQGMSSAVGDQALVGPLDWRTSDPAWSNSSPVDNIRRAELAMERASAEPVLIPVPDNGHPPDAAGTTDVASPPPAGQLTAGVPTTPAAAPATPVPARLPTPEVQTAPPPAETIIAMPGCPILFNVLTAASPDAAAGPQAIDMAGPLAQAHSEDAKVAEGPVTTPATANVAGSEASSSHTPPLDTSTRLLAGKTNSPAVPSEFLASRFGSAVPIARLAQATTTEDVPENGANGPPPPVDDSPKSAANGAEEDKTLAKAEKLGDEPVNNQLEFLRTETVLLKPCEWQIDIGMSYLLFEDDVPIVLLGDGGEIASVVQGTVKERRLFVPLAIRYGWNKSTQLFCDIPLGWADTELSLTGSDDFDDFGGVGDIVSGATFLLRHCDTEDVVLTTTVTLPTGGDPYDRNLVFQGAALGEGFWALSADVLCIRSLDPLAFFYGAGTRHSFAREFSGSEIKPGGEYRYQFGVGLGVTPRVTLSTRFSGGFVSDLRVNNRRVPGTLQEPMSIRLAATISQQCRFVEPFVEFGLTDDAPASYFGVVWTY